MRYMRKALLAVAAALFCISLAHAQTDVLIEIDRGPTEGIFTKSPVFQRAILAKPAKPTDTALLYFRGYPGIARIQSVAGKESRQGDQRQYSFRVDERADSRWVCEFGFRLFLRHHRRSGSSCPQ